MKKLGVRIIGAFFLFWAISKLIGLITELNSPRGFLGFELGITYNDKMVGVMGWVGVYLLAYTGYHLIKLNEEGRAWALGILWISVFGSSIVMALLLLKPSPIPLFGTISFLGYSIIDRPVSLLIISGIYFVLFCIQIYFLMRKDVKMEFQSQTVIEAKPVQSEQ